MGYKPYRPNNKYHATKCEYNGEQFDSRREMRRFQELSLLERAGHLTNLKRQIKYVLIPSQYKVYERYGKKGQRLKDKKELLEREVSYIADFVYEMDGKTIVEDAKGVQTKDYIIKRKLMLFVHGIKIKEV